VPPRRPLRGRHRKPKSHSGPAYVTAATLAAFAVSGLNVPGAIGDAREGTGTGASGTATQLKAAHDIAAGQLRHTLVTQQAERASRLRAARTSAVKQVQVAAEAARAAREAARPKWILPVDHYRLTAGFGEYGLWAHSHTGQDFAAPQGTPIHAVGDGKIIFCGWDGAYGNKIAIQHPDGTVTWYAHMSAFVVTSGVVKAGQVIGKIGSTGNTTGPHLHLEVRPGNGDPVPPLTWLREHGLKP
jgi:murein DD-endopeptidase MepM/ murein hydrolase activator NlpD